MAFHRLHYRPDGANIVVVGDVTVAEIRPALLQRLSGWTAPATALAPIPRPTATVAAESRRISRDLSQTTVLLGRPSIGQDDPDYFPLAVATYVLGGGSASRLYTRVREEKGLAYSVFAAAQPGRYGASYLVSLADPHRRGHRGGAAGAGGDGPHGPGAGLRARSSTWPSRT